MTPRQIRTFIVDDDDDMRFLLRIFITRATEGLEVVGEARTGEDALSACLVDQPDIVVTDHRMPGMSGVELAEHLRVEVPSTAVILYSAYLDAVISKMAESAGVCAVLEKDHYREIPAAIRACVGAD
jgi:YesN/AraC family two-component response regulator